MKKLRRNFARFCARNRDKGIPNLMLYIAIGNLIVLLFSAIDPSGAVTRALYFDPNLILHGQVWRLFTYVFTYLSAENPFGMLLSLISLFCYYWLGRSLEGVWGVFKFNLYYFSGILITDIAALALRTYAGISSLNLSLFLAYATLYPDTQFLLMYIIPIKARWLALAYLFITLWNVLSISFPTNLFPLFALLNYFIFLGSEVGNLLPDALRFKLQKRRRQSHKTVPFPGTSPGFHKERSDRPAYTHKCTVCGRTDVTNPELEFRYCSKCNGYYCYCSEHINNHTHIQ